MLVSYRQTIFTIFAIFYIVLLPFLIILSLGYDVNFQNAKLNNTLTIKVESYPRGGNILTNTQKFTTPAELRTQDGKEVSLKLETSGFMDENFRFYSTPGQNSTARVLDLWLLSKNNTLLSDFKDKNLLSVLSENLILFSKGQDLFLSNFGFAGLQGGEIKINKSDKLEVKKGYWLPLLENIFWQKDQGLILFKQNGNWQLFDLNQFPMEFISIAKVSEAEAILLDKNTNLWSLNYNTRELSFIDAGFNGLYFTDSPDVIWILKKNKIYKLNRTSTIQDISNLENFVHASSPVLGKLTNGINKIENNDFVAKSLFLGMVFKVQNNIFYVPDSNQANLELIATDVAAIGGINSNLFWVDQNSNFFVYDLLLKTERNIGTLDFDGENLGDLKINYYSKWTRVFIYSNEKVYSLWYDTRIVNESILKYYPVLWIQNSNCFPEIFDNYQFCNNENKLVSYKNNSLPF